MIQIMKETDEELVELCKKGDDNAFQELMRRYTRVIFNFTKQYTKNEQDTEDIVQDSFFKAWKSIKQFKAGNKFKSWMFTIARNTALDHTRKRKLLSFSELDDIENDLPFADTIEDTEPLQHEVFDQVNTAKEVMQLLEIVHPEHRAIMILHYQHEMTFEEISNMLKKPMNTIKSWHHRALVKIRDHLHQNNRSGRMIQ